MAAITLDSIAAYPALQAKAAVIACVRQLVDVRGGEGVLDEVWHTYAIMEKFTPWAVPAMKAARQQRGEIGFDAINAYQYPLALIAMALLPFFLVIPWAPLVGMRDLAATAIIALYANAAVCGIFSNPHDRYGARLVWIASLTVMIAALRALGGPRAAPAPR
jgi:hypothetical protein